MPAASATIRGNPAKTVLDTAPGVSFAETVTHIVTEKAPQVRNLEAEFFKRFPNKYPLTEAELKEMKPRSEELHKRIREILGPVWHGNPGRQLTAEEKAAQIINLIQELDWIPRLAEAEDRYPRSGPHQSYHHHLVGMARRNVEHAGQFITERWEEMLVASFCPNFSSRRF